MDTARRTSRFPNLFIASLVISSLAAGCGNGDDDTPDGGIIGGQDATGGRDAIVLPDMGMPDSGPLPDTGPADGGHYCVGMNGEIDVEGTDVRVGEATSAPTNPVGTRSALTCIARRPTQTIGAPLRYRGCVHFLGASMTLQQLEAELEIDVFRTFDQNNNPVDPSYGANGVERGAANLLEAGFNLVQVTPNECESGILVEIGRNAQGASRIVTDFPFTIRVRSSTIAAQRNIVDTYYQGVNVRTDALEPGSAAADRCQPDTCSGLFDLLIIRQAGFQAMLADAMVNAPGTQNLNDLQGAAHALLLAHDCQDAAMTHATAGFSPQPAEAVYLDPNLDVITINGTETSSSGIFAGLGFTNTSTVYGAVGVLRDGTCTEAFGGVVGRVFPDSITVFRSGREATIRP